MPEIFSNSKDGHISYYSSTTWATARSSGTGTSLSATLTANQQAVATRYVSGRGGTVAQINRSFFSFDTSGISSPPSSATLKIYGYISGTSDIIVVRATNTGGSTGLSTADFDALHGASTALSNSDGAGAGTLAGISGLDYSAEVATWSTSGYNDITLNSEARTQMANLNNFNIAVLNYDHDYLDIASVGSTPVVYAGMYYADYTGTSRDPKIDYTTGTAGYGNTVIGVSSANIASVKGVATADIANIIGVD